MREIKFRTWYPVDKKFVWFGGLFNLDKLDKRLNWDLLKIQQFTGLKDKNGKEIYEGDIIVCRDGKYVIEDIESFAKFVMTQKDLIKDAEQFGQQDADTCMRSIEIIGNKFENPELLK